MSSLFFHRSLMDMDALVVKKASCSLASQLVNQVSNVALVSFYDLCRSCSLFTRTRMTSRLLETSRDFWYARTVQKRSICCKTCRCEASRRGHGIWELHTNHSRSPFIPSIMLRCSVCFTPFDNNNFSCLSLFSTHLSPKIFLESWEVIIHSLFLWFFLWFVLRPFLWPTISDVYLSLCASLASSSSATCDSSRDSWPITTTWLDWHWYILFASCDSCLWIPNTLVLSSLIYWPTVLHLLCYVFTVDASHSSTDSSWSKIQS